MARAVEKSGMARGWERKGGGGGAPAVRYVASAANFQPTWNNTTSGCPPGPAPAPAPMRPVPAGAQL